MNSKALSFFILAVVALGMGIYSYMDEKGDVNGKILNLEEIKLKNIKNIPTGLATYFKKYNKEYILADLIVNGSYEGIVSFDNVDTDVSISVKPKTTLKVKGITYKFSHPTQVNLMKFKGKIDIVGDKAYIKGIAKEVVIGNDINIQGSEESQLEIRFNNTYNYIYLENATEEGMILPNFKGNIIIYIEGDTIDYKVKSKYIEFLKYYGESNITRSHIILHGEGIMKSNVLITPLKE